MSTPKYDSTIDRYQALQTILAEKIPTQRIITGEPGAAGLWHRCQFLSPDP